MCRLAVWVLRFDTNEGWQNTSVSWQTRDKKRRIRGSSRLLFFVDDHRQLPSPQVFQAMPQTIAQHSTAMARQVELVSGTYNILDIQLLVVVFFLLCRLFSAFLACCWGSCCPLGLLLLFAEEEAWCRFRVIVMLIDWTGFGFCFARSFFVLFSAVSFRAKKRQKGATNRSKVG